MSTALVQQHEWESKLELIRRTVAKDATNDELEMFFHQARKTGLDPLARQIHFVKRGGKGVIQTGIDGYRLVADRTGKYAGNDDYEFDDPDATPKWAKARVWKIVDGVRCPFEATARWSQYYPGDTQGWAWKKMPHLMLGKCAEALALRKAFPAELSGMYTADEMAQADKPHIAKDGMPTLSCEDCEGPIEAFELNGRTFTIHQVLSNGRKHFDKDLCANCQKKRVEAAQEPAALPEAKPKKNSKQTKEWLKSGQEPESESAEFEVTDQEIAEFHAEECISPQIKF